MTKRKERNLSERKNGATQEVAPKSMNTRKFSYSYYGEKNEWIIFESLVTVFEVTHFFEGVTKNWLEPKIKRPLAS